MAGNADLGFVEGPDTAGELARTSLETALSAHQPMATPVLELSTASAVRPAVAAGADQP